jgi:phospholipid/cholesterol/gamma-HCH transport system substrate-binding protein
VRRRGVTIAAFLAVTGILTWACSPTDDGITLTARFDDVGDLAPSAPVMMADVTIGKVTDIRLIGQEAVVTMEVEREARVPQGVEARVRRTSLLGERIVDLHLPDDLSLSAPPLRDGASIAQTDTRPDLEDLVREGSDLLAPIVASEVATLVDEGARGFGGRGEELRTVLANFSRIVEAYSGRTGQIRSVILSLDRFNRTLASRAGAHARATANTARSIEMLKEESDRLERAIRSLNRLAVAGEDFLVDHSDEMGRFFRQMRVILGVLRQEQDSIIEILQWAPHHNRNLQTTEYGDFVQVYQDFIVCGLNDDPSDPARRCEGHR